MILGGYYFQLTIANLIPAKHSSGWCDIYWLVWICWRFMFDPFFGLLDSAQLNNHKLWWIIQTSTSELHQKVQDIAALALEPGSWELEHPSNQTWNPSCSAPNVKYFGRSVNSDFPLVGKIYLIVNREWALLSWKLICCPSLPAGKIMFFSS